MEVIDNKGLDKACICGSGKIAAKCCRKDEKCTCGSGKKVVDCCADEMEKQYKASKK